MIACLRLLNLERDRLLEDAAVSRRREEEQGERREESDIRRKEIEGLKVQLITNMYLHKRSYHNSVKKDYSIHK